MSGRPVRYRSLPLLALAVALAAASSASAQAPPVVTDIVADFEPGLDLGTTVASTAGDHTIDGGTLAGANLFHSLREADQLAAGRVIAVAPVPEVGLGRAINDRLRRAAAPR